MLARSLLRRVASSSSSSSPPTLLHHRRRWEQRIASVLTAYKEDGVDAVARRFQRIYKDRQYTPVEEAFPLLDVRRWEGVAPPSAPASPPAVTSAPAAESPHVVSVAFLGAQNSGKSSLVNALGLGHVSVVSNRAGSTSDWVKLVAAVHDTEMTLIDTPGILPIRSPKDRRRHAAASARAWDALYVCDLVVLTVAAGLGFVEAEEKAVVREVMKRAACRELPVVLAVTMMDRVQTPKHRELYFAMRAELEGLSGAVAGSHETSAVEGRGLVALKDALCGYGKPGAWSCLRNEVTDMNPVERVAELLRQVFFDLLPHEIPHEGQHRIIGWTRRDSGVTEIIAEVFFARPAYLFTFYAKLEAISLSAQRLVERELKGRYRFVFQAFIAPGGVSTRR